MHEPGHDVDPPTFPHGVASFDPTSDSVLLWTRVEGGGTCRWHLGAVADPDVALRSGEVQVDDPTGCVTIDVGDLDPGREYRYWFSTDGARSRTGRTRTLPTGSPRSWRLGVLCCADYSVNHLTVHRHLAAAELDLVLHLGDYIYENEGKGERTFEPDHDCVTVDDFDLRYAQVRRDAATKDLHASHPMVAPRGEGTRPRRARRLGVEAARRGDRTTALVARTTRGPHGSAAALAFGAGGGPGGADRDRHPHRRP